ncbi:hypothetical protein PAAG_02784 [Paracoccidioides lutzii Pb01]|uniref:Uncharacterized protein n=1 Tax=Paracoccidioides lutzii (strain ATCC MYA-826 / Pb01) TaxID=502779 RepID=C1GW89_PARBA|nr:hypothetical protein PAAG_02784 [Paracoccidioides lutzii Pb01]EEH40808.1 hypothetical protein PAAG_02784 [Paracoccidioides lutzii Pb01]
MPLMNHNRRIITLKWQEYILRDKYDWDNWVQRYTDLDTEEIEPPKEHEPYEIENDADPRIVLEQTQMYKIKSAMKKFRGQSSSGSEIGRIAIVLFSVMMRTDLQVNEAICIGSWMLFRLFTLNSRTSVVKRWRIIFWRETSTTREMIHLFRNHCRSRRNGSEVGTIQNTAFAAYQVIQLTLRCCVLERQRILRIPPKTSIIWLNLQFLGTHRVHVSAGETIATLTAESYMKASVPRVGSQTL